MFSGSSGSAEGLHRVLIQGDGTRTRPPSTGVVVICGRDPQEDNEGIIVRRVQPEDEGEMDAADYFTERGEDLR
jgi:hypothetical protein